MGICLLKIVSRLIKLSVTGGKSQGVAESVVDIFEDDKNDSSGAFSRLTYLLSGCSEIYGLIAFMYVLSRQHGL